jgi:hypothetical protein
MREPFSTGEMDTETPRVIFAANWILCRKPYARAGSASGRGLHQALSRSLAMRHPKRAATRGGIISLVACPQAFLASMGP